MLETDVVSRFFLTMFMFVITAILIGIANIITEQEKSRNIFWSVIFVFSYAYVTVKIWT